MKTLDRIFNTVDKVSEWTGKVCSWAIIIIIFIILWDVIMRRGFANPTIWAFEVTYMIWGGYFVMVSAWTEKVHGNIAIDVYYQKWSPKVKAITDVILYGVLALLWMVAMVLGGISFAGSSWESMEVGMTVLAPPLYILKTTLPLGFGLLFIQTLVRFFRSLRTLIKGGA